MGLFDELRVHGLDVDVGDALRVVADQGGVVGHAVDDVAGVQAETDVLGVGGLEDAVDVLAGLDVGVAVRVEDHREAVVLLHHATEPVGVVDVQIPGLAVEVTHIGELAGVLVAEHRWQVHHVLGADGGVGFTDGAEGALRVGPGLGLVEDAPTGAGDDAEASLAHFLGQALGVGGEVTEGTGLHHGEPGLGHLVEGFLPRDLRRILGEPDAPLVGTDTDGQLVVSGFGVAGLVGHGGPFWRIVGHKSA